MKKSVVRPATISDLDQILAIEWRWPTTPHWTRAQFEAELAGTRAALAVLEQENEIIGYGGMWLIIPEAQITTIAVKPEAARQGHGRILLTTLLETARLRGCRQATLEVSAANAAALRLYQSEGFRIVGRRTKFYNDGSDAILMDRDL